MRVYGVILVFLVYKWCLVVSYGSLRVLYGSLLVFMLDMVERKPTCAGFLGDVFAILVAGFGLWAPILAG